ncbi:MAG: phosphoribosylformylglycinamidine synthase [Proteobacteria bacterium]|nr:phosphoribosylformylglycinamidine synthase [Pseudomonadota bacterium]
MPQKADDDALRAVKFMAVKAAVFILIPLLAALLAVWWRFG